MTLREAIDLGVRRVRKPYWHPTGFWELPGKEGGLHGVWCTLHDELGREQPILFFEAEDGESDWEPLPESD